MGWKCAPQVMGLVRGEPKAGQKHRANGRKIAMEAGYERASLSDTLDRTRSNQNEYEGYRSGKEFWDVMEQEASEYRVQVKGKTKTGEEIIREKGLQHNAVIGWAVIYNPPAEVCRDWTQAQYKKFHEDCQECMGLISPIFRKENIRMTAFHKDEGVPADDGEEPDGHFHDLGISLDENGHYCGTMIDAKLLVTINKKFPALMRERGWDMDDLDVTDFDRAKVDSDYKAERDFKRGQSGKSVNQHIRKTAEKLMDEAEAVYEAGTEMLVEGSDRMAEADARELALAETEEKHLALQRENVQLTVNNNLLRNQFNELDAEMEAREAQDAEARKAIEESCRMVVRFMRGAGHEDEKIDIPDDNEDILDLLQAEMIAFQKRLEQQQQIMLQKMTEVFEKMKKSADRDTSRKRFMQATKYNATGRSLEDVYQEQIAKKRSKDAEFLREAKQIANGKVLDDEQKQ